MQRSILAINRVIPSLTTFHKNIKFISIRASIIKTHLNIAQPKSNGRRTTTLLSKLTQTWNPTKQPFVEVNKGRFRLLAGKPSLLLSYTQLFISMLRQFPQLSDHIALRNRRSDAAFAQLDHKCLERLFNRANALGFKNNKVYTGKPPLQAFAPHSPSPPKDLTTTNLSKWRGSKPFINTLFKLRKSCFLPSLAHNKVWITFPTPSFIQNNLVTSFFGIHQLTINKTNLMEYHIKPKINIAKENVIRIENLTELEGVPEGMPKAMPKAMPEAISINQTKQGKQGKTGKHSDRKILRSLTARRKVRNRQHLANAAKRKASMF